ncbi:hypothetical protein FA13DRAFT_1803474 [Coprinellus micaceus]|uniref:Uncharacterized protein n=1 Tax=Coprinellus micaceus TaxID=71717 RepID=A0A4Y7SAV3_COPMI|nr:hypothetical protein FA13DRAFT_1803474 [Coprinellus micaceus]
MAGPDPPTALVDKCKTGRASPLAQLPTPVTNQQGDDLIDGLGGDGGVRCAAQDSDEPRGQHWTFQESLFDTDLADGQPTIAANTEGPPTTVPPSTDTDTNANDQHLKSSTSTLAALTAPQSMDQKPSSSKPTRHMVAYRPRGPAVAQMQALFEELSVKHGNAPQRPGAGVIPGRTPSRTSPKVQGSSGSTASNNGVSQSEEAQRPPRQTSPVLSYDEFFEKVPADAAERMIQADLHTKLGRMFSSSQNGPPVVPPNHNPQPTRPLALMHGQAGSTLQTSVPVATTDDSIGDALGRPSPAESTGSPTTTGSQRSSSPEMCV